MQRARRQGSRPECPRQPRLRGRCHPPAVNSLARPRRLWQQQLPALLRLGDAALNCRQGRAARAAREHRDQHSTAPHSTAVHKHAGQQQPAAAALALRSAPASASSCRPSFCRLRSAASSAPRERLAPSRRRRSSEAALQHGEEEGVCQALAFILQCRSLRARAPSKPACESRHKRPTTTVATHQTHL